MTQQEMADQNIRLLIGDLQVQLVFAKTQIADLEQRLGEVQAKEKANGDGRKIPENRTITQ